MVGVLRRGYKKKWAWTSPHTDNSAAKISIILHSQESQLEIKKQEIKKLVNTYENVTCRAITVIIGNGK